MNVTTTTEDADRRRVVALHEAGHSSMSLIQGDYDQAACKIFGTIRADLCGLSGRAVDTSTTPPRDDGEAAPSFDLLGMEKLLDAACVMLAGCVAAEIATGARLSPLVQVTGPDGRMLAAMVRGAIGEGAGDDEYQAFLWLAVSRTWRQLTSRWCGVLAVADALEQAGHLTADEAGELFNNAVKQAGRAGLTYAAHVGGGVAVLDSSGRLTTRVHAG